jgi:tetratricopeptide (TPR) repeat protein
MAAADGANRRARTDLGIVRMRIGLVQHAAGDYAGAVTSLTAAAEILDPPGGAAHASREEMVQASYLYEYRARTLEALHQKAAAVGAWRRSLELCSAVLAARAGDPTCQIQVMMDHNGLAVALARNGQGGEAIAEAGRAVALAQEPSKLDRPSFRARLPRALAAAGEVYGVLGDRGKAREYYRRAVKAWGEAGLKGVPWDEEIRKAEAGAGG